MINFFISQTKEKGKCVFSKKKYEIGELIGEYITSTPNLIGKMLTSNKWETDILGRFCSHNSDPNTELKTDDLTIYLYAIKNININDEIVVNYVEVSKILNLPDEIFYKPHFNETILKYNKNLI